MVRRLLLFAVVLGVMSVSIHGQVSVTEPLLGVRFAVTLAIVLDVGALLALNEVLTTRRDDVRRWGWTALLLAAGLSVGLNVWHAVDSGTLPLIAAVAVGAIPVVLAGVLSHLLALSLSGDPEPVPARPTGTYRTGTGPGPVAPHAGTTRATASGRVAGTGPAVPKPATTTAAGHRRAGTDAGPRRGDAAARTSGPASEAVPELPAAAQAVWERARELDTRHRADTGRAAPYALLRRELGIGQGTVVPLYRALADAADPGTAAGTRRGTRQEPAGTENADPEPVPQAGTPPAVLPRSTGPRLALVPADTEPVRPGTGDGENGSDAAAATARP